MLDAGVRESDRYAVAVIGAGPAGIAAAAVAAESGQRVILLDECPLPGGQIWRHSSGRPPHGLARKWMDRLRRSSAVVAPATAVIDLRKLGDTNFQLHTVRQGTSAMVRANRVVLATGARELFLPFPGWTLPGVIGVGAAQALVKSGMSVSGKRIVIAGSGPLLMPVAATLRAGGGRISLVAEQAGYDAILKFTLGLWRRPAILWQAIRYRTRFLRTRYRTGVWVAGAEGNERIERVSLTDGIERWTIECDLLCAGFGLVPNVELARLAGCRLQGDFIAIDENQETSIEGIYAAGEPTGIGGVDLALAEGILVGYAAAGRNDEAEPWSQRCDQLRRYSAELSAAFPLRPELRRLADAGTILCRCEDVRFDAIRADWTMRQAKLYTRVGMGPCQGRVCGAALHHLYDWPQEIPHPPVEPVAVAALL